MKRLPGKCLVDTNVPKIANLAVNPDEIDEDLQTCVIECIRAVRHVTDGKGRLVMDAGDEIYDEYRRQLSMKGQPGVGDGFMKWVHDHRWSLPEGDRVEIHKNGDSYLEFSAHDGLKDFDKSDRKFVAVANAHPGKPPILQAADSKWWGWRMALTEVGITVTFLCPDYVERKYRGKMGEAEA